MARAGHALGPPAPGGHRLRAPGARGHRCASAWPIPFAPFAEGGFPTPSGKCELLRRAPAKARASIPLAGYVPPRENVDQQPRAGPALPAGLHLAARASLPELDLLRAADLRAPRERAHASPSIPTTPPPRGIADGAAWSAPSTTAARSWPRPASPTTRGRGWWSGLSIWWAKMCPGGRNANAVTSQELTDMGGGRHLLRRAGRGRARVSAGGQACFVAAAVVTARPVPAPARPAPAAAGAPLRLPGRGGGARAVGGLAAALPGRGRWPPAWPCSPCCPSRTTPRPAARGGPDARARARGCSTPRPRPTPTSSIPPASSRPTRSCSCRRAAAACWS